jgi:hypothetical protein
MVVFGPRLVCRSFRRRPIAAFLLVTILGSQLPQGPLFVEAGGFGALCAGCVQLTEPERSEKGQMLAKYLKGLVGAQGLEPGTH